MKKLIYKILGLVFALFILNSSFLIPNCMCQWVQMSNGMGTDKGVWALTANENTIYAGTSANYGSLKGVYTTTDNGINWSQTSLNNVNTYSVLVNENYVFAGTENGIYLSTNNGSNWTQTSLNNQFVYTLALNGNTIFAGTYSGVFLSTNNGTNWIQTSVNLRTNTLAVFNNNIFAGTDGSGIFVSSNNGTNWAQINIYTNSYFTSFAISGNMIFAGRSNATMQFPNTIIASTDTGVTWSSIVFTHFISTLTAIGNNIFAGTVSGIFVSTNTGMNWTQRNEGWNPPSISVSFCILNNYIFAGSNVNSVYRRPLGELVTVISSVSNQIPLEYSMKQNYPNPFNPTTKIKFEIPNPKSETNSKTEIRIYDVLGKEVAVLVNENLKPGIYDVEWDGTNYSSGMYFYKLESGNYIETKKMLMIK